MFSTHMIAQYMKLTVPFKICPVLSLNYIFTDVDVVIKLKITTKEKSVLLGGKRQLNIILPKLSIFKPIIQKRITLTVD